MEEQSISELIKSISAKMRTQADSEFKKHGLTFSQAQVLCFIKKQKGETTQRAIEAYLNVSHPTVVGLVTRLEKSGFVTCSRDDVDKRNKLVRLTDKAASIDKKLTKSKAEADRHLTESLTEKELSELTWLLKLVDSNL